MTKRKGVNRPKPKVTADEINGMGRHILSTAGGILMAVAGTTGIDMDPETVQGGMDIAAGGVGLVATITSFIQSIRNKRRRKRAERNNAG